MNSRERVAAMFDRKPVDRVPLWCGASPEFMLKACKFLDVPDNEAVLKRFGDDFRQVFSRYSGPELHGRLSIFGVERGGIGYGQPLNHPLSDASIDQIDSYSWPDADLFDVSHVRSDALAYGGQYAILGGEWSPFFHDAIDMLGMENMMILMYEEPEKVHLVLDHIVDFYLELSRRAFEAAGDAIDIFFIGNDFGSQTGPLVGPELFRQFLAPQLKKLADLGHSFGHKVQLHCCGSFVPLIPMIIESGIDALQSLQPITPDMQPSALKARFGSRILFNGCIDSIKVLIDGTPALAEQKTKEVLSTMLPDCAYILSPSHDYLLEETPVENVLAMYDTARSFKIDYSARRAL